MAVEDKDTSHLNVPHVSTGFIGEDTKTVTFWVSTELADRMTKAAAKLGVNRSHLIRQGMETYMKEHKLWSLRGPQTRQKEAQ